MKTLGPTEKQIQTQILTALGYQKNVFVWRANTGGFVKTYQNKDQSLHRAFIKAGIRGSSDIQGVCRLDSGRGSGLYIEVKRPGAKTSPEQKEFLDKVNSLGNIGIVATSIDDVRRSLAERGCSI